MRHILRAITAVCLVALLPACGDSEESLTIIQGAFTPPSGSLVGLSNTGDVLIFVNPANPSVILRALPLDFSTAISLMAIAIRPANGALYGWGSDGGTYQIDMGTGAVVPVVGSTLIFGSGPTSFDASFNPVTDRMRLVTNQLDNARINPITVQFGIDTNLASSAFAIAHSNNVAGAATTTLYAVNNTNLMTIGGIDGTPSPNGGTMAIVGLHGAVAGGGANGLAISPSGTAYMTFANPSSVNELWTLNLTTGAGTVVGPFGAGATLRGIAVIP